MAVLHNQINKLWYNPSYEKFKNSNFVKQIFTEKDADDFIKTGAYLIKEAEKLSNTHIAWDESKRLEILKNPRLENAFVSLGTEYLFKGIFLCKGYAINKLKQPVQKKLSYPILLRHNLSKLNSSEVVQLKYIVTYLPRLIDFNDFNASQIESENKAKKEEKGQKLQGITRMTIPYPNANQMLDYLLFKRNYSLHRPFIISEFKGITNHVFNFLEYVALHGYSKSLKDLSKLTET